MRSEDKLAMFEEELNLIPLKPVRIWVENCLLLAPDYFFEIGAADSGWNHPIWDIGPGGLVRHSKAVAKLAYDLSGTFYTGSVDPEEQEKERFYVSAIVAAGILHDSCKYGVPFDYRMHDLHPYIPRVLYKHVTTSLIPQEINFIFKLIESHMGSYENGGWSPMRDLTKDTLSKNPAALVLHMADYMTSRSDFVDARFADINKDYDRETHQPYEPFPDEMLKGLIIGVALRSRTMEDINRAMKDGSFDALFYRVAALRSPYGKRRREYNYDSIIKLVEQNVYQFIPDVQGDDANV